LHFLDPDNIPDELKVHVRHYAVSLCPQDDQSSHWLHYGRRGDGYAIGLRTAELPVAPFELAKVVYDREEQRQLIREAVRKLEERFLTLISGLESREKVATCEATAHMFSNTMWALAGRLNVGFASEDVRGGSSARAAAA
jgi:hypothetical protein